MLILDFAIHKRKIKTAALGESELLAEFARPVIVVVVQEGDVRAAGGENALVARERAAEVLFVLHIEKARVADGLHRFSRVRSRSLDPGGLSFTTTTSTSTPCWSSTEWMARGSMSARLNVGIMTDIFMGIPSCVSRQRPERAR